jgi:hypothetical protein
MRIFIPAPSSPSSMLFACYPLSSLCSARLGLGPQIRNTSSPFSSVFMFVDSVRRDWAQKPEFDLLSVFSRNCFLFLFPDVCCMLSVDCWSAVCDPLSAVCLMSFLSLCSPTHQEPVSIYKKNIKYHAYHAIISATSNVGFLRAGGRCGGSLH